MPRSARLILHWLGLADHPDPWSGPTGDYFVSDKATTCAYLASRFPPKVVELLSEILGAAMIAHVKERRFLISQNYVEEITGYRVVMRGKDFVTSEGYSAVWERHQRSTIIRDDTDCGYWVASDDPLRGFREYFRRINPDEFASRTSHLKRDGDGFPIVTPPSEATLQVARRVPRPL